LLREPSEGDFVVAPTLLELLDTTIGEIRDASFRLCEGSRQEGALLLQMNGR
jgi:hypothetical protein